MAKTYGLTIAEFEDIISTETKADFGADMNEEDAEDLFLTATTREWDFNSKGILADLGPSSVFYPYITCYSDPMLSGYRRILQLHDLFASAVAEGSVFLGDVLVNVRKARTCIWVSSLVEPYRTIAEKPPEGITQYLEFQPHQFSMKIVDGTTELIAERMANPQPDQDRLGLVVSTCPVYLEFIRRRLATHQNLTDTLVHFLVGGSGVYNSSFYVEASQDENIASTSRMDWWANVISNVTDRTDPTTGENACFDVVIPQKLKFDPGFKETIGVYVESLDAVAMTEEEVQDCLWYVLAGLAIHPYSCQIEPEFYPVPFPKVPTSSPIDTALVVSSNGGDTSSDTSSGTSRASAVVGSCIAATFSVITSVMIGGQ